MGRVEQRGRFLYDSPMFRIYVERKAGFQIEALRIHSEITGFLGVKSVKAVRCLNRYDVENVSPDVARAAVSRIFSELQSDDVIFDSLDVAAGERQITWEYLPGQYDQRADSADQCLLLLRESMRGQVAVEAKPPRVRCAKVVILQGDVTDGELERIRTFLINPVDSRLDVTPSQIPQTLEVTPPVPPDIPVVAGFSAWGERRLESYRMSASLAMDTLDLKFLQEYFKTEGRDPTETEIRVLDTYWSDHCRHTTFNTILDDISVQNGQYSPLLCRSLDTYKRLRRELYGEDEARAVSLMDMATIGAKVLRKRGKLADLEVSDENNACCVYIDVNIKGGKSERWLLQFKNETHNHPTEIEPFGGAATCIGGAIRDPLSGRAWVYQAMRVTGAADPTVPVDQTIKGKLPQKKITREAAQGFSSYGNQIGLATGQVAEVYHAGYAAKRMELGAVIAAAPCSQVLRETPQAGDVVILLGGGTGRDGIGGATGSSKVHTEHSVATAGAEVQKGNAVEERKIQRLFRSEKVCRMIRRCNDFGAGGVAVAVGEIAPSLEIDLDAVPKKYEGLNGTELAISESQERMAVVVRQGDVADFIAECGRENLNATIIAHVTDTARLVMKWRGKTIVDLRREFLDSAGAPHHAKALIESPAPQRQSPLVRPLDSVAAVLEECITGGAPCPSERQIHDAFLADIADLACCGQRGLCEMFDGSIGAGSVLMPFGGREQGTPEAGMAARLPVVYPKETSTASLMSFGFDPRVSVWSPWHGSQVAVLSSLAKITCLGGQASSCRLSFQEYFGRAVDERTWGAPAAALLGAIEAQLAAGVPSIGGKDSMSGTFEGINVPHTLVSFAVCVEDERRVCSGAFKKAGSLIYLVEVPYSPQLVPNWEEFKQGSAVLHELNAAGKVSAMYPVGAGGIAEAVAKMAFGNRIGCTITAIPPSPTAQGIRTGAQGTLADLFTPLYGSVVVETDTQLEEVAGFAEGTVVRIGYTQERAVISISVAGDQLLHTDIALDELYAAWQGRLEAVFPTVSHAQAAALPPFALEEHVSLKRARDKLPSLPSFDVISKERGKPRVLIPVFPGTNCEYDMARAFALSGAEAAALVFCNRTADELARSLEALQRQIGEAQILAFAGGFSVGDEPDGSGKYIANVIRERRVAASIARLLERGGLILGICNGFQALVKSGLLPFGRIAEPSADLATLTFNNIGRHVSRVCRTRTVSALSPWAAHESVLDGTAQFVPVSHGEGRLVISESLARELFEKGQVFSQYVDDAGQPTMIEPANPNGSSFAIEGITSPDGRILGKMGHNERTTGGGLLKNVAASESPNIFAAGVRYFCG